ncbi:hypothetical protein HMPREF1508_0967 [Shuttleworthella sp. MSX8B]|nr:hypothetical protein HMPREF1508_0967 [Shuttleworthia sp. MSX8B]
MRLGVEKRSCDHDEKVFSVLERGEENDYSIWHAKLPGLCGS